MPQTSAKILCFPPRIRPHRPEWWGRMPAMAAFCLVLPLLLHAPLLRLPYFWDEAGYYIPAARDLFLTGQLIPTSTLTNAHPPLVMIWLAMLWKLFGYHAIVTRIAMLVVAALTLTGVYRLAQQVANRSVAVAATVCTALFPVFFAQSTMAHLDMAAAALTIWGLSFYLRYHYPQTAACFGLAVLAKETALLAPAALVVWELAAIVARRRPEWRKWFLFRGSWVRVIWLAIPAAPLALWFLYHYRHTGFIFGNPEFLRYNVGATLRPVRVLAAFAERLWQLFGYMGMFVLTLATLLAMTRPPLSESSQAGSNGHPQSERPRIAIPVQLVFAVVVLAYLLALSVVGGAVLARYLLPVYPLVIIIFVSTLWRRLPWWPGFVGIVCLAFLLSLVINPPYHFAPEDNLDYAFFVRLHQDAAKYLEANPPGNRVLTAWPASDELSKPFLGYVEKPLQIARIDDFSLPQIITARQAAETYDTALLFSTKYEPSSGFLIRLPFWEALQRRYFDYHRDLPPEVAAQMLGGRIVFQEERGGQWVAVLKMDRVVDALNFRK